MLTVVIPTHNRNSLLRRTLDSLAECERPTDYARTIVIENGGRHGAEQVCRDAADWLNVNYRYHEQGNKSAALNSVLPDVDDDLLVFFDDDVRLHPDVLTAYVKAAARYDNAFFGGPVDVDYEVPPLEWVKLPPSAKGWSMPDGTTAIERPDFLGFNWAAHAADLRHHGEFNPAVGPGGTTGGRGQETDAQQRLIDAGVSARYVPNAMVWHFVPADRCSPKWSLRRAYQHGVSWGLSQFEPAVTLFGYPRWTIPEVLRRLGRALLYSFVKSRRERYLAWHEYYKWRGFMDGRRLGLSSPHPPCADAVISNGQTQGSHK